MEESGENWGCSDERADVIQHVSNRAVECLWNGLKEAFPNDKLREGIPTVMACLGLVNALVIHNILVRSGTAKFEEVKVGLLSGLEAETRSLLAQIIDRHNKRSCDDN